MKIIKTICIGVTAALSSLPAFAQQTYEELEQLTVNEQVTTVITASEPIRFVDISTDKVVGDQPINNTIRLKPKETGHEDGEVLAVVTIVTERYRTQYALLYTTRMQEAVTDKEIEFRERNAYNNPAVSMSQADMTQFARRIWNSPAKYRNVRSREHRMTMRLNNIYHLVLVACIKTGWISPSHTNMRANTTTCGSFLPTVISNGMNAHPAVISARNHSGGISGVTDSE